MQQQVFGGEIMLNQDIRDEVKNANLKLWQVGYKLSICDSGFSRKLRKELSKNDKAKIRSAISELKKEGKENDA